MRPFTSEGAMLLECRIIIMNHLVSKKTLLPTNRTLELDVSEQLTYQAQHIATRRSSVCVKIWIYTYGLQGTVLTD